MNAEKLKKLLQEMKENEWALPNGIDPYAFALEMMEHIGSVDPILRDKLILECLWTMINRGDLNNKQLKELLSLCLSEKHLFYDLGNKEGDGVFNRAFTVLIVGGILSYGLENDTTLLSEEDAKEVFQKLVHYVENEQDKREYVEHKGWADAIGHWALTFDEIVRYNAIGQVGLRQTLELIKKLVCINDTFYCQNEDERFTTVVMAIVERGIIPLEEILEWLGSFESIELSEDYLEINKLCYNRKNFLRSLYFRLKYKRGSEQLIERLEKIILAINPYNR